MNQMIIAERLIALRKKAGLSQSAVADLLSVTRQAVSKWESGKTSPSLEAYSSLAALYTTSIELILTGADYEGDSDLTAVEGSFFAERLKNLRQKRALSQGDVSEALSVSRQSVSKWERGEAEPDAERLIALSKLFNAPLKLLLPYTKAAITYTPDVTPEEVPLPIEEPIVVEEVADTIEEPIVVEEVVDTIEEPIVVEEVVDTIEEPIVVEEVADTVEEPIITLKQDEPTKKRYRDMLRRAAAIRQKHRKENAIEDESDKTPPFKTISDIGPNDPAYVYVNKDDGKTRTMIPFLAALPICAAALLLITKKKKKK